MKRAMDNENDNVKEDMETISVGLTKEQAAQLKCYAESRNLSESDVICQWIENADLLPSIPPGVCQKLQQISRGRRGQTPAKLIESVLKKEWEWKFGWQ